MTYATEFETPSLLAYDELANEDYLRVFFSQTLDIVMFH